MATTIVVALLLLATACSGEEPVQVDDDAQRADIEAKYQAVYDGVVAQQAEAGQGLDEGREQVQTVGEIGFEEIDIDELLDDDE